MGRPPAHEFAQFNGLLASAVERQVPLGPAIELLAAQTRNASLRGALETAVGAMREGAPLPEALARSPEVFPPHYAALVDAGLRGGRLAEVLRHAETYGALRARVARRVAEILAYLGAAAVLFLVVVLILSLLGQRLSAEVRTTFGMEEDYLPESLLWMERYWWGAPLVFLVFILLGTGVAFVISSWKLLDRVGFWIPLWGRLVRSRDLALFSTTMAVRLGAGVAAREALLSAETAVASAHAAGKVLSLRARIEEGESLSSALFYEPFFPRTLAWAVSMGEARGEVADVFDTFARVYSAELDRNFGFLLQILTPLGLIALGNVVLLTAMVVLAPFGALIRIQQTLSQT